MDSEAPPGAPHVHVFLRVSCPAGKGPVLLAPDWMSCWVGALPPNSWPARALGSTGSASWTRSSRDHRVRKLVGLGGQSGGPLHRISTTAHNKK